MGPRNKAKLAVSRRRGGWGGGGALSVSDRLPKGRVVCACVSVYVFVLIAAGGRGGGGWRQKATKQAWHVPGMTTYRGSFALAVSRQ